MIRTRTRTRTRTALAAACLVACVVVAAPSSCGVVDGALAGRGERTATSGPAGGPTAGRTTASTTVGSTGTAASARTPAGAPPGSAVTTTVPALTSAQLLDLARDAVVRVRNTGCGELSTGSAWFASDGRMVSNRHVVEGVQFLEMSTWDGRDLEPQSAETAEAADISRIAGNWTAATSLVPLKVRTTKVVPGERVHIVGYPEGDELQVSSGKVVDYLYDRDLGDREVLRSDALVRPGNSGGPLLDDRGQVVGVVYAKEVATSYSLSVPVGDVFGPQPVPLSPQLTCR